MNTTPLVALPDVQFLEDVWKGLAARPKSLSCKYFYDDRGSELFDQITTLDEYYLTPTECGIFARHGKALADCIGADTMLIEYGSGSSQKTELLLDDCHRLAAYVPVDICGSHLLAAAQRLRVRYPHLLVRPVCADFTAEFALPEIERHAKRRVVFFPGSTIGNFHPTGVRSLLAGMARRVGPGGGLLIGVDLDKDPARLEAAYNDASGVTAAFNLNLLARINRELAADFDLAAFRHQAIYNRQQFRIEMHLESERAQVVNVAGRPFHFAAGETILTEYSYKYQLERFAALAQSVGWNVQQVWLDDEALFSVQYLEWTGN